MQSIRLFEQLIANWIGDTTPVHSSICVHTFNSWNRFPRISCSFVVSRGTICFDNYGSEPPNVALNRFNILFHTVGIRGRFKNSVSFESFFGSMCLRYSPIVDSLLHHTRTFFMCFWESTGDSTLRDICPVAVDSIGVAFGLYRFINFV